eukprot:scaffold256722_cov35-Tisochrysis_lutea.AAC.2
MNGREDALAGESCVAVVPAISGRYRRRAAPSLAARSMRMLGELHRPRRRMRAVGARRLRWHPIRQGV